MKKGHGIKLKFTAENNVENKQPWSQLWLKKSWHAIMKILACHHENLDLW